MADGGRLADVKVGAFVLVALAVLIAGSLWIAGSTLSGARRLSYVVLMPDSGGLQAGDRVRVSGVSVGRIQHVRLRPGDPWPVTLAVSLKPDVAIRSDATARVATSGLLGAGFLDVDPGSPTADRLPEGAEIRGSVARGLDDALARLDEISTRATGLLDQTSTILEAVSRDIEPILQGLQSFLSRSNAEDVSRVLTNLRRTTEETGPRLASLLARLESISGQLEGGIDDLPRLTDGLGDLLEGVQTALGPDGRRLAKLLDTAESSLGSADDALAVLGGNREQIEATLGDLRETVANLKTFSQQIKERPYSLIRIRPEPDRTPGDGVEGGPP